MNDKKFDDFVIGETAVFKKTFSKEDLVVFQKISGDFNPLHCNDHYASESSFERTIVPLHLVSAPLSAIAGMVFPGHRSLYLSHDLKAINPVFYGDELTYSAKIIEKNSRDEILTIRTLIFKDTTLFVEAIQKIKVRNDEFLKQNLEYNSEIKSSLPSDDVFLITGALGDIGKNICLKMIKEGKKIIPCVRSKTDPRLDILLAKLKNVQPDIEFIEIDLLRVNSDEIKLKLGQLKHLPTGIIHTASPHVNDSLEHLIRVNLESLKFLFENLRYSWFCQQQGQIIYIGSSAVHSQPQGWENYSAAKLATINYVNGLSKHFARYGIKANVLSPGLVDTSFSKDLGLDMKKALCPEQVSDEVFNIVQNPKHFYTWLEFSFIKKGDFGFIDDTEVKHKTFKAGSVVEQKYFEPSNLSDKLKTFLSHFFNLEQNINWSQAGINMVSGWDSLRHIELVIDIESAFGVKISSVEVEKTTTFAGILNLLNEKLSPA